MFLISLFSYIRSIGERNIIKLNKAIKAKLIIIKWGYNIWIMEVTEEKYRKAINEFK